MQSARQILTGFPHDWYRQMRATNPVYFEPRFHIWYVFRYEDALRVLNDPATFSSETGQPSILGMDPPRHNLLRNLISRAFTPRIVAQLEGKITEITNELLDAAIARGQMDVIRDLAYPLPATIIAELLGVPSQEREMFIRWSNIITAGQRFGQGQTADDEGRKQTDREFREYFAIKLEEHRRQPDDDLMSSLILADVDGQRLNQEELLSFCRLLLFAGYETTANLIGNAMLAFEEHPDVVEELRGNPELMPGAIEEILRCYGSVIGAVRHVTTDTHIGKQALKRGDRLIVRADSANYDEEQFHDPERFNIRRMPNRHISFGHGLHYCLGAPLARLEGRIALNLFLQRLRNVRRNEDQPLEGVRSFFLLGLTSYPIIFTAR
ncbi:putative cytochrome P450 YjiB [Reticulibacter mediterranei]|uniref:Putative cytochrome P450 YjiB n=1 Tax=Reticulibacter mediterranei TaxID=2778369 RepID=A0A8J3IXQ1_9CHLR|nr:cytochrome P450 [Reticulibacter mediterranei]GHO97176.1 putative cytochrome P450 YjiB [Reticulibacter mediterranei]